MPPSWIVIRCLPGRVGAVAGGGALEDCGPKVHDGVAKRIDIPREMFPHPNPPQLPNLRWWPNKKMCTRVPKIRRHCRLQKLRTTNIASRFALSLLSD